MSNLKERIDHIESEKEWLDDRIGRIFVKYCEIYGIHLRYGVRDYELWYSSLDITQDTSCMGCSNSEQHKLPIEYLYAEDYESLIKKDLEKHQQEEKIRKAERLEYEIEDTKKHLAALQEIKGN